MPYKIRTASAFPITIPDAAEDDPGVITLAQIRALIAAAGGSAWTITAIQSHDYNAAINELVRVVTVERGIVVTLPASGAATAGQSIAVKNTGNANGQMVTISPTGGDTIDGGASATMSTNHAALTFVDNGDGDWSIEAAVV